METQKIQQLVARAGSLHRAVPEKSADTPRFRELHS
jgi:hypothetical protein